MKKSIVLTIVSIIILGFSSTMLQASSYDISSIYVLENGPKVDTVEIKTSAVCNMCKERLEHDMAFEKGVKSVTLDNETKVLTIVYKPGKTTEEDLKKAITKIGYDADEMQADKKAHDRLPACCQKGIDPH